MLRRRLTVAEFKDWGPPLRRRSSARSVSAQPGASGVEEAQLSRLLTKQHKYIGKQIVVASFCQNTGELQPVVAGLGPLRADRAHHRGGRGGGSQTAADCALRASRKRRRAGAPARLPQRAQRGLRQQPLQYSSALQPPERAKRAGQRLARRGRRKRGRGEPDGVSASRSSWSQVSQSPSFRNFNEIHSRRGKTGCENYD